MSVGTLGAIGPSPRLMRMVALAATLAVVSGVVLVKEVLPAASPAERGQHAASAGAVLAGLPLYFAENAGQIDPRVSFYVPGSRTSLYFTSRGVTFALQGKAAERWAVGVRFPGAAHVTPQGLHRTSALLNYFRGPRSDWHTGVRTYSGIVYRDLWPGIDLVFSGATGRLEYRFVVHPGSDPSQIRLAYRGATSVRQAAGGLRVSTPDGSFSELAPRSFQSVEGSRAVVPSSFASLGADTYGFDVGAYDRSRTLVIDPTILIYAGYVGGNNTDYAAAAAVDGDDALYVTGYTSSLETGGFPLSVGPDLTQNGNYDAFVAKVDASGTSLDYAGYIGGSSSDFGNGIAVDPSGNAYVTGYTSSTESTFPVAGGPDTSQNGGLDAFVAKVDSTGSTLTYSGFIGGSGTDVATGIAVNDTGNAFVSGYTTSDENTFPHIQGPDATYNGGLDDAFVAKVSTSGASLDYAGYIGGGADDHGYGVAIDGAGDAFVTGATLSDENSFPVAGGPDLTHNGGDDGFVAEVNAQGTSLVYAGYIGGAAGDDAYAIAVDHDGNAYVTGGTGSDEGSFPVGGGPDLTYNGAGDGFVAKVDASGTSLDYAGYVGGDAADTGQAIAVDPSGRAYVTGQTSSSEASFPVVAGPDVTYNGGGDAFVARVSASGSALSYAGYIGGNAADLGNGIAVDSLGNAFVAGQTSSTEVTFPETAGPDLTENGIEDAFVARIRSGTFRPDSLIKKSKKASPVGGNVYGTKGAHEIVSVSLHRGSTQTFFIEEQNDGTDPDSFTVKGPGAKPGFTVKYLAGAAGTTNVTKQVTHGTYLLPLVASGSMMVFRLVVHVKAGAAIGDVGSWLVGVVSGQDPSRKDAVKAVAKVVSG